MMIGWNTGIAAALAARGDRKVRDSPYAELRARLAGARQALDLLPLPLLKSLVKVERGR